MLPVALQIARDSFRVHMLAQCHHDAPALQTNCCISATLQAAQSHRQLQRQVQSLSAERDQLAAQHEQREGHLLELQGQLDLLRCTGSESEAWLTNM